MTDQVAHAGYAKQLQFLQGLHSKVKEAGIPPADMPDIKFGRYGSITVDAWLWPKSFLGETDERAAVLVREDIEVRMARLLDLFPGAKWEKNDPSKSDFNASYYILNGKWEDVTLTFITARKDVCERVVMMTHDEVKEVPDPELVAAVPLVKVTETVEIVEWQCNSEIARKTSPLQAVTV